MNDIQIEYIDLIEQGVDPDAIHVVYKELYNDSKTIYHQKLWEGELYKCLSVAQDYIDIGDSTVRVTTLQCFNDETATLH